MVNSFQTGKKKRELKKVWKERERQKIQVDGKMCFVYFERR